MGRPKVWSYWDLLGGGGLVAWWGKNVGDVDVFLGPMGKETESAGRCGLEVEKGSMRMKVHIWESPNPRW